ncbi:hypothetical protein SynRS9902_01305 [Synechococcus sp. RS9902]|nr:hypothetical protein SynRS9902_01305 [Synechococcus sp. RS9902]
MNSFSERINVENTNHTSKNRIQKLLIHHFSETELLTWSPKKRKLTDVRASHPKLD